MRCVGPCGVAWLAAVCLAVMGCGGSSSGGTGGTGAGGSGGEGGGPAECDPVVVEVEDVCTAFCANVIGECRAFTFNEEQCRGGCEDNLEEAYGCSDDCGVTLEAMFQCVAEMDDCRDVFGWRDVTNDHACVDEVGDVGVFCPF